ncbi:uncharacterized protein FRV6_16962 [Fusarium oxysporum]|jgi:HrpA-like RNA helicase
MKVN